MVEVLGSEALVYTRWEDQSLLMRCSVSATRGMKAGDRLMLVPDTRHPLHWFDAKSGARWE